MKVSCQPTHYKKSNGSDFQSIAETQLRGVVEKGQGNEKTKKGSDKGDPGRGEEKEDDRADTAHYIC